MEKCSFFNSINHDRVYDSANFAAYYGDLFTNGVIYDSETALQVRAGNGFSVDVLAGSAWINGYRYFNTGATQLIIDLPLSGLSRIDRIVVRWSLGERNMYLAVLRGTPSTAPEPPALTRNSGLFEIALADLNVSTFAAQIEDAYIVDQRLNPTLCGSARTRGYLSYGEADTEALINNLNSVMMRVSKLENQDVITYTKDVIWLNTGTTNGKYTYACTLGDARIKPTSKIIHVMTKDSKGNPLSPNYFNYGNPVGGANLPIVQVRNITNGSFEMNVLWFCPSPNNYIQQQTTVYDPDTGIQYKAGESYWHTGLQFTFLLWI